MKLSFFRLTPLVSLIALAWCLAASNIALAGPTSWSTGWSNSNGDLRQFYQNGPVVMDETHQLVGSKDGRAYKSDSGGFYQYRLDWPDTKGTVTIKLSQVNVAFNAFEKGKSMAIDVNTTTDASGAWTRVGTWQSDGSKEEQSFTFEPTVVRYVRLVNLNDNTWMNIGNIHFWGAVEADAAAQQFLHPGTQFTQAGLDFQWKRIQEGSHAADVTVAQLKKLWPVETARDYQPGAVEHMQTSPGPDMNTRGIEFQDTPAIYPFAMMWYFTGEPAYADAVIRIIDDWATKNKSITGAFGSSLSVGLHFGTFAQASDLLKYGKGGYAGWNKDVDARYREWFNRVGLPLMERRGYTGNSNWSTNILRTGLAYAVFTNDRYQFNRLCELWRVNIANPMQSAPWGEISETTRDMAHAQMNIAGLGGGAEIAWAQGVDLYAWNTPDDAKTIIEYNGKTLTDAPGLGYRLANLYEYHAKIANVGGEKLLPQPQNIAQTKNYPGSGVYTDGDGKIPVEGKMEAVFGWSYEDVYNHYKNILGVEMPELRKRIEWMRTNKKLDRFVHGSGWSSITHAGLGRR